MREEQGFAETFLLAAYLVFALTMMSFLIGLGLGMWKQAQTRYGWFTEAIQFAAQAANMTGDTQEVRLNSGLARQYLVAAMDAMVGNYRLDEFRPVAPGEPVPGGRAEAPGYLARVTLPVFAGQVPWVGQQYVQVPMRYFAVVRSAGINQ